MRLIRDEQAYFRILDDFVTRRVCAAAFMPRFQHLWQCDEADGIDGVAAKVTPVADNRPGLYGLLDTINTLCETYARSLPDGCGYRVSEEQFRTEVQSRTTGLPLAGHGSDAGRLQGGTAHCAWQGPRRQGAGA